MTIASPAAEVRTRILLLGCSDAPEFSNIRSVIEGFRDVSVEISATCDELAACEEVGDLLVVLQRYPEEYSARQVLDLLNRSATSRLIVCCGPWCDSDGRTRNLWPPASRVRCETAGVRLRHELSVLQGESDPLPLTADRDEAYLFDAAASREHFTSSRRRALRVEVETADPAVRAWLSEALDRTGYDIVADCDETDITIVDVDPWTPAVAASLAVRRRTRPQTPLVALVGFLRPQESTDMNEAGAAAILAKLSPLSEIVRAIDRVVEGAVTVADSPLTTGEAVGRGLRIVSDDV